MAVPPSQTVKQPDVRAAGADQTIITKPAGGARPLAAKALPAGVRLGPELGRGGFGLVNLATQEVFGRRVAVKRLLSAGGDEARRFHAEAIVTATLQHPNVVPIHDLTLDGDGRLQLVMKVIEGVSWRDLIHPTTDEQRRRAEATTLDDHVEILIKVCDAVGFAHDRGVLHRDLKTENVMVGAFGEVQVMDWGCAVAFGAAANHPAIPRLEAIDQIAGTPSFMAPEIALERVADIGPHTDVYLLGGMLYHVLTDTAPHRGETAMEALCAAAEGLIEPPDERAPGRGIPDELAWIAMSALAKDPAQRTRTVAAFARQLKEYRAHVQAARLTAAARQLVADADRDPARAEDLLRRAMAAADNALELWPERTAGLRAQLLATLAYARHALARLDFAAAESVAERAATMARALRSEKDVRAAADTASRARAAAAERRNHERQVRLLRLALAAAGAVVLVGLIAGVAILSAQQRRTREALDEARSALAKLDAEQQRRRADQRGAAPGLAAQARQLAADKHFDDAQRIADVAVDFDPELAEARLLAACLDAAGGRYDQARAQAGDWARLAPDAADARALGGLCERLARAGREPTPDLTLALGELFARQRLNALAESRMLTADQRAGFYRKRIEAAWQGAGAGLDLTTSGTLRLEANDQRASLTGRADVVDLAPLAGMPFVSLSLARTGAFDLSPVVGKELVDLDLWGSKVHDLGPLARCPALATLDICGTEAADLRPLAGLPLRSLRANRVAALSDLSPLARAPLERLAVADTAVRDLSPLRDRRPSIVDLSGCAIADWRPLAAWPLRRLSVSTGFDDEALALVPADQLELFAMSWSKVTDLLPLRAMKRLDELWITALPVSELAPLAGLPLRSLHADRTRITDLTMLRTLHQLAELDVSDTPLKSFWALSGLRLSKLRIARTRLDDLSALDVTSLTELCCDGTLVTDLAPLRGGQLSRLSCAETPLSDLSPLIGIALASLDVGRSRVADLRALKGMTTLRELAVDHAPVADYRPIAELPLERLIIGPFPSGRAVQGMAELRQNRALKAIGVYSRAKKATLTWPAADFWRRYDAGEMAAIE